MAYNLSVPLTLLVLRHAKSSWDDDLPDIERPLKKRGVRAAKFMGNFISDAGLAPDAIVSSPAERALSTAQLLGSQLGIDQIFQNDSIYHGGCSALVEVVGALDNAWRTVLLVGHNPGMEELVDRLSGQRDTIMKTASLAVLRTDADAWAEAAHFDLAALYHPRELMDE